MQRHISPIAKQRISDFFTQEDGNVGRKNALTAGTILSGAMLTAAMFVPEIANACEGNCGEGEYWCGSQEGTCCSDAEDCCSAWNPWTMKYVYYCTYGGCP